MVHLDTVYVKFEGQGHSEVKFKVSGGSRGRRLGQLPREPREGAPKRGGIAKITGVRRSVPHGGTVWKSYPGHQKP